MCEALCLLIKRRLKATLFSRHQRQLLRLASVRCVLYDCPYIFYGAIPRSLSHTSTVGQDLEMWRRQWPVPYGAFRPSLALPHLARVRALRPTAHTYCTRHLVSVPRLLSR
jgi:hypothetical protein